MKKKIGIIGCGNMGSAIVSHNKGAIIFDKDLERLRCLRNKTKAVSASSIQDLLKRSRILIIAVKPQNIDEVLGGINNLTDRYIVVSIAAGITTRYIENKIGGRVRVVRVMPNIAAQVKSGISVICKGRFATNEDILIVEKIFCKLGKIIRAKESYINAFTAVAGSGPAYIFYFMETLIKVAQELGFNEKDSVEIVKEVVKGSVKLLEETGLSVQELRHKVTSKGGTTEAALNVLRAEAKFEQIIKKAVKKAAQRAEELSRS